MKRVLTGLGVISGYPELGRATLKDMGSRLCRGVQCTIPLLFLSLFFPNLEVADHLAFSKASFVGQRLWILFFLSDRAKFFAHFDLLPEDRFLNRWVYFNFLKKRTQFCFLGLGDLAQGFNTYDRSVVHD